MRRRRSATIRACFSSSMAHGPPIVTPPILTARGRIILCPRSRGNAADGLSPAAAVLLESKDPLPADQKGPDARRRPRAAREAYSLYVERAAEGANEAAGPLLSGRLGADLAGYPVPGRDLLQHLIVLRAGGHPDGAA